MNKETMSLASHTAFIKLRIVFVFLLFPVFLAAQKPLEDVLFRLDKLIAERQLFTREREQQIQSLVTLSRGSESPTERYQFTKRLSNEYLPYNIDSALHYAEKCIEITSAIGEESLSQDARLQLGQCYLLAGMYHEASILLEQMSPKSLNQELTKGYYSINATRYRYMQAYLSGTPISIKYNRLRATYQDSLLQMMDSNDAAYPVIMAERMIDKGEMQESKHLLQTALKKLKPENRVFAYTAYTLADAFKKEGNTPMQMQHLALSAESDIRCAIKENAALRELALLLYESGDIERAYRYIKIALDDALFSNARLRTFEILQIMPVIDHAYQDMRDSKRKNMIYFVWIASFLSLFLLLSLFFNQKQKRKLQWANGKIKKINTQLNDVNQQLKTSNEQVSATNKLLAASNRLQEEYIARYLKLCSTYIGKMDNFRTSLHKKAAVSSKEELVKMLKSKEYIDKELKEFYADFDQAFLDLHPGFVSQFNELLREEEQIVLKSNELLNTELRIFALIRLGITDSPQIADFLRYSVTTIYNYRTKVRNKARISRDLFEKEVMKLGISG